MLSLKIDNATLIEIEKAPMAKRKGVSKTAAIRAALKSNASPTEVAAMLTKKGIKVSPQYVSTIKANDKRKSAAGKTSRGPGRPPKTAGTKSPNGELKQTADLLMSAADLIVRSGGAAQARDLITMADKIVGRMN